MKRWYSVAAVVALGLVVAAAGMGAKAEPKGPDPAKGKTLYQQKGCVPCHGPKGKGDGPMAKSLTPKPTNFTDKKVMSKRTDAQLFKAIKSGGKAVGKSPAMPAYGEQMSDAQIKDLVAYIRTLAKKK